MKFEELAAVELPPYNRFVYERIREELRRVKQLATTQGNVAVVKHVDLTSHLSYCVQNLHKNFVNKLLDLLAYYNKNDHSLPSAYYFEPSLPKVFPPPPKTDDDLPILMKTFIHHADYYDMQSMPITWIKLIEQFLSCMDYAIETQSLPECVVFSDEGCFDICISEMGIWKASRESMLEAQTGPSSSNNNRLV